MSQSALTTTVITSPNQAWVPQYPVERTVITTYQDGRWGLHEYSHWPQFQVSNMWHVACIPAAGRGDTVPPILWVTLGAEQDWSEDPATGVPGLGYLKKHIRDELTLAAQISMSRFRSLINVLPRRLVFGEELCLVLQQCVD